MLKAKGKAIAVLNLLIEPWNGVRKFPYDYLLRTRCISHETTNMRTTATIDTIITTVLTLTGVEDAR